ncbi:hypothetical protein R6Q59_029158 [Mikania micrantha]
MNGPDEGLVNTRPRKRSRPADVENVEAFPVDGCPNIANIGIHSLSPDLNLPPQASNPNLRRRSRRRSPPMVTNMVDVNIPSQSGIFRFGALVNPTPSAHVDPERPC